MKMNPRKPGITKRGKIRPGIFKDTITIEKNGTISNK